MTVATSRFYDDIATYTADVQRRAEPREAARLAANPQLDDYDYGVWWRDENARIYRLSWQDDTDELYLVRLNGPRRFRIPVADIVSAGDPTGDVEVLAVVPAHDAPHGLTGPVHRDDTVEKILADWPEKCEQPLAISWLRGRIAWAVECGLARYP